MRTLNDLADFLESRVAVALPQQASNERAKRCAILILVDLLRVTPVDTSKAISNWQVALDTPSRETLPAYAQGSKGSTALASQEIALSEGQATLARKQPAQRIFITNNLPYIRRLNDGWSKQAPAGFVERAMLIGRLFAENQIGARVL